MAIVSDKKIFLFMVFLSQKSFQKLLAQKIIVSPEEILSRSIKNAKIF